MQVFITRPDRGRQSQAFYLWRWEIGVVGAVLKRPQWHTQALRNTSFIYLGCLSRRSASRRHTHTPRHPGNATGAERSSKSWKYRVEAASCSGRASVSILCHSTHPVCDISENWFSFVYRSSCSRLRHLVFDILKRRLLLLSFISMLRLCCLHPYLVRLLLSILWLTS